MKRKQEFTLIELLVVIAIISVLATMLFPVIGSMKEKANQTKCSNNLKQLGIALKLYADNYEGNFPYVKGKDTASSSNATAHLENLYLLRRMKESSEPQLYICPSSGRMAGPNTDLSDDTKATRSDSDFSTKNISYAYFTGSDPETTGVTESGMSTGSGIMSDGYLSGTVDSAHGAENGTGTAIWNHDKSGRWLRVDTSVQAKNNHKKWPDLVGGNKNKKGDWKSFNLSE